MLSDPTKLQLSKPAGVFNKELKIDFTSAFKAIGKGIVDGVKTDWGRLGKDVIDLGAAFGLAKTTDQKAYILIYTALIKAATEICAKNWVLFPRSNDKADAKILGGQFDELLNNTKVELSYEFFDDPRSLPFLNDFIKVFEIWLKTPCGLTEIQAKQISVTYRWHFMAETIREWKNRPKFYEEVQAFFENHPWKDKWEQKTRRVAYYQYLQSLFTQSLHWDDENLRMTLADIYIEPRYSVFEGCFKKGDKRLEENRVDYSNKTPFIWPGNEISLTNFLKHIFQINDNPFNLVNKDARILVLYGSPGQGKTSFCKRLLNNLLEDFHTLNQNVYFIRLREISGQNLTNDPIETLYEYLNDHPNTNELNISKKEIRNSILVLDGLDELFMNEGLREGDFEELFVSLRLLTETFLQLKIIITSRPGPVRLENLVIGHYIIIRLESMDLGRQILWLKKYKQESFYPNCPLTVERIQQINNPEISAFEYLRELIGQPILLQIIATSGVLPKASDTRSEIYKELFNAILERKYSKRGKLLQFGKISANALRNYLGFIALHIFHSNKEYVLRNDLEKLDETTVFLQKLGQGKIEDSLKDILIAFYFQEVKTEKDQNDSIQTYAIEFLHKSLQEYLVAEYLWNEVKSSFTKKDKEKEQWEISTGKHTLDFLFHKFSPKILTHEITTYLVELIENESDSKLKETLVNRLSNKDSISYMLKSNFLVNEGKWQQSVFPFDLAKATFWGYWTIISTLGLSENIIPPELKEEFIRVLSLFIPFNKMKFNLSYQNFSELGYGRLYLPYAKLQRINISNSNFPFSCLSYSGLSEGLLNNTNLYGSYLDNCDFTSTNIRNSDLSKTSLVNSKFNGSDLKYSNFSFADLTSASFENVNLQDAYLNNADLRNADLRNADLRNADLRNADLRNADLRNADLRNADLRNADLRNADLRNADLRNVKALTKTQLLSTKSLNGVKGLPGDLLAELKVEKPSLFEEEN